MTATLARFTPLTGISLFIAIGFGWRTWLQCRRYGKSGVVLFRQAGLWATLRDGMIILLPLVLLAVTAGQALAPGRLPMGRFPALEQAPAAWLGLALLIAGIVLMTAAQLLSAARMMGNT